MDYNFYTDAQPSDEVGMEVLNIVSDNITDLTLVSVPPSNLLYAVYEWTLQAEIGAYMTRIGRIPGEPHHLLVAIDTENDSRVSGFLLYSPVPAEPTACGVNYMAVRKDYRGSGIASEMVRRMLKHYHHTELSCTIKLVPFYESLGFQVIGSHLTQVTMCTLPNGPQGTMAVLNVEEIFNSPDVGIIMNGLVARWGRKAVRDSQIKLYKQRDQLIFRSERFVQSKLKDAR